MFTSETNQVQGQSRLGFRGSERGDWCGTADGNRFVLSLDVFLDSSSVSARKNSLIEPPVPLCDSLADLQAVKVLGV